MSKHEGFYTRHELDIKYHGLESQYHMKQVIIQKVHGYYI